jgi:glutamate-5-semialdehyde dehydrogenase
MQRPSELATTALQSTIGALCAGVRAGARKLAPLATPQKNAMLLCLAARLRERIPELCRANADDLLLAREKDLPDAFIDRLLLDSARIEQMAQAVEYIATLADPVGEIVSEISRPNGLRVRRVRVPVGVIAMIYEARPNVTVDAVALAVKAGNAIILRGGSEARNSNLALFDVVRVAMLESGLPVAAVALLGTERDEIRELLQQTEFVDLAIPRGGEALIRFVTEHARVPVVQHYKGVCHMFLDAGADLEMAMALVSNAKLSRPGVCNALECLLIDRSDAARLLPPIALHLQAGGCELRVCERSRALMPGLAAAAATDFGQEFLDRILAIRLVDGLEQAIEHIERYGSGHTEAIVTPHPEHAEHFERVVDAACVVVNASTRFHDGGELGLGAEMGIATSRLHWRGPMGLEALTTMKWQVKGSGQVRS